MFDLFAKNTLGPLILRVGLGVIFIYHGLGKVNADTDWGATWQQKFGMPNPHPGPMQMAYAGAKRTAGGLLASGWLRALAAPGVMAPMSAAFMRGTGIHLEARRNFE